MSSAAEAPGRAPRRDTPLRFLRGVGPRKAERLAEAGFLTVDDLLLHLPLRYEDRRKVVSPADVAAGGRWTVRGVLAEMRLIRTRRRGMVMVRGRLVDESGAVGLVWFNQPYLLQRFSDGDRVVAHGPSRLLDATRVELLNPSLDAAGEDDGPPRVVPIYPRLAGMGPGVLRRVMAQAVAALRADPVPERLPPLLRERYGFEDRSAALEALHAPAAGADLAALDARSSPAYLRLVYEELLDLQLELAELRRCEIRKAKPHAYRVDDSVRAIVRSLLPFALTGAQKRVVREIVDDLRSPEPMLRLLQGDVGSGKTIVAAIALLLAAQSGLQGAFMAPTELLAEQHFANLRRLLGESCRVGLFTRSSASHAELAALAAGEVDVAIGTHALIQEAVRFRRLGLAVIDEQHRFGVAQRRSLQGKGELPDVLVMTATPIPRSLALTAYGDLEISVLDEMPPGRTPIRTEVVPASGRGEVYRQLRSDLESGARAYVVFPLIDDSDELAAGSLERQGDRVREYLARYPSALLHGRLPAVERDRLHRDFAAGRIRVLIATTVIEVGIDVPEATWMVIESAERFGLAQLHQLRGRVGRGTRPSRCVAIHGRRTDAARHRLELFARSIDGFEIAEADLALRGPGDLLGTRQAGLPELRIADLVAHREWVERARGDAREIAGRLDEPGFAALAERARRRGRDRYDALAGG